MKTSTFSRYLSSSLLLLLPIIVYYYNVEVDTTFFFFVDGHSFLKEPMSRNRKAYLTGLPSMQCEPEAGVPFAEYCEHCLNTKGVGSVCGTSEPGITNYDDWLDSLGNPIPWNSNGNVYEEEGVISIETYLRSHHTGHMELKACPVGDDDGRDATQECFDRNVLEFVQDVSYEMPKDEDFPGRAYYWGTPENSENGYQMKFKLPENLVGEKVLLQYLYVTANSCTPEGYANYYTKEQNVDYFVQKGYPADTFWNAALEPCLAELPTDFYTGVLMEGEPERFVNCAEITVLPQNGNNNDNDNDNDNNDTNNNDKEVVKKKKCKDEKNVTFEIVKNGKTKQKKLPCKKIEKQDLCNYVDPKSGDALWKFCPNKCKGQYDKEELTCKLKKSKKKKNANK